MAVNEKVEALIQELRDTSDGAWKGMVAEDLRPWFNFSGIEEAGKFDIDTLRQIFDRNKLNDDYLKVRQEDEPKAKDVWVAKIQGDLLAGFQRDHFMRTRSRVRLMMHGAARHKSNGQEEGPLTVNTVNLINRLDPSGG